MAKPDKKQRQKAKRQAKQREGRRRASVSPVKRLADAPGEVDCWVSEDFESMGQMELFVYKRAGGLSGMAAFLVDRGVVGLKDAWVTMHLDRAAFDDVLRNSRERGIRMRRASVDEVRRWVAGGLRWAHDNGMRLPKDWAKPASVIGGVGDWESADVSGFAKEFAGHPEDLRQRLVAEPLEAYLRREDIHFEFDEGAPYMDQKTGMYIDELSEGDDEKWGAMMEKFMALADRLEPATTALASETAAWITGRGEEASTELREAWTSVMLAAVISKASMPDASEDEARDFGGDILDALSERIDPAVRDEYERAVDQAIEHWEADREIMQRAIKRYGLAGELDVDRGRN